MAGQGVRRVAPGVAARIEGGRRTESGTRMPKKIASARQLRTHARASAHHAPRMSSASSRIVDSRIDARSDSPSMSRIDEPRPLVENSYRPASSNLRS